MSTSIVIIFIHSPFILRKVLFNLLQLYFFFIIFYMNMVQNHQKQRKLWGSDTLWLSRKLPYWILLLFVYNRLLEETIFSCVTSALYTGISFLILNNFSFVKYCLIDVSSQSRKKTVLFVLLTIHNLYCTEVWAFCHLYILYIHSEILLICFMCVCVCAGGGAY